MLGHANGGIAIDAHAETHFDIGAGGTADCVDGSILVTCLAGLPLEHEETIFIPGDLMRLHPERIHSHFMLRLFILFGLWV